MCFFRWKSVTLFRFPTPENSVRFATQLTHHFPCCCCSVRYVAYPCKSCCFCTVNATSPMASRFSCKWRLIWSTATTFLIHGKKATYAAFHTRAGVNYFPCSPQWLVNFSKRQTTTIVAEQLCNTKCDLFRIILKSSKLDDGSINSLTRCCVYTARTCCLCCLWLIGWLVVV